MTQARLTTLQVNKSVTFADAEVADLGTVQTVRFSVADTITAGATQTQAGATPLTALINRVTVVGTDNDGVRLPSAEAGLRILIVNDDAAQDVLAWPATGDRIDGGTVNGAAAAAIGEGTSREYVAVDATNWYTV
jgi:hypothetical protein